jgi:hypothetical protein
MKLDRDMKENEGRGKYALVRLRTVEDGSEAARLLFRLDSLGVVDWGRKGDADEFFVIKLRDKYADAALKAYSDAAAEDARRETDEEKSRNLFQWSIAVLRLVERSGVFSPFCKRPD